MSTVEESISLIWPPCHKTAKLFDNSISVASPMSSAKNHIAKVFPLASVVSWTEAVAEVFIEYSEYVMSMCLGLPVMPASLLSPR